MNAATLIDARLREHAKAPALWLPQSGVCSFEELDRMAHKITQTLHRRGLDAGAKVLLLIDLSPLLYATVLALARAGMTAILVEPWMPMQRLAHVFALMQPQAFIASRLGQLWGWRVPGVRRIPHWIASHQLLDAPEQKSSTLAVDDQHPCIISFTSGTSSHPKGVVRTHGYLRAQHSALNETLHFAEPKGPDLCIFANFALANLANGRCSLIIPAGAKPTVLQELDALPDALAPVTATCGPGFLLQLMQAVRLEKLQALHVGGAQTDCAIFERAFALWPAAQITHVYGSTEAEPVATANARDAVRLSREQGLFQTLFLGQPWSQLRHKQKADQLWIQGPHVCPAYLADTAANQTHKEIDAEGLLWHRLGDRVAQTEQGWWYQGRDHLPVEDFRDEQRLYAALASSTAFIQRDAQGNRQVFTEKALPRLATIRRICPDIKAVYQTTIHRDARHRARIDRVASAKGAPCIFRG